MRLRGSDKPLVTSTGYQDIRINIWGNKYGPRPKPVGFVLLAILMVVAIVGIPFAYDWQTDAADKTSALEEELQDWEDKIKVLKRPPDEEMEIAKLEAEINRLQQARETIRAGYGHYGQTIDTLMDIAPPAANLSNINMTTKLISLQGELDTPQGVFDFARALEANDSFRNAHIVEVGRIVPSGRPHIISEITTGSVDVTIPISTRDISPADAVSPGSITDELFIPEGIEEVTPRSGDVRLTIADDPSLVLTGTTIRGSLDKPPVTFFFSGSAIFPNPIASYKWDYGDGSTKEVVLEQPAPSELVIEGVHTYTDYGSYSITLTVTDIERRKVTAMKGGIFASPDVDFSAGLVSCENPKRIKFEPEVETPAGIRSYNWYFTTEDDESDADEENRPPDSTEKSPVYSFKTLGEHEVKLTVIDRLNRPKSRVRTVNVSGTPTANFVPERIAGIDDFTLRFNDDSQPDGETGYNDESHKIVQWTWDFGDGTPVLSGSRNPIHTYATSGPYTVTLKVTETDGNCATVTKIVQSRDSKYTEFFVEPGGADLEIKFSAPVASADNIDFMWDFGELNAQGYPITATDASPSHVYDYNGIYHVTLRIDETLKSTASEIQSVTTFLEADVEVEGSTSTAFQLRLQPAKGQ